MESDELRFRHVGLSSDGAVVFCDMDNGKTYAMPLYALERAEDWNPKAKPKKAEIIHDGYAALVKFDTGLKIDFPSDFVLHVCEPAYTWHKDRGRNKTGIGKRIREIRLSRGLTLDALAAKSGIAKPNLSRLEHDKVTPTIGTLRTIAEALNMHPIMLVVSQKPKDAWKCTRESFGRWMQVHRFHPGNQDSPAGPFTTEEIVASFLQRWPEHGYAREKLLKHADLQKHLSPDQRDPNLRPYLMKADK